MRFVKKYKLPFIVFFISVFTIFGFLFNNTNYFALNFDKDLRCINKFSTSNKKLKSEYFIIGHAYGAHSSTNNGLSDNLLKYFQEKEENIILTGDIVRESSIENLSIVKKQLNSKFENYYISVGNHDFGENYFQVFGNDLYTFSDNNLDFVVANFSTPDWKPSPLHQKKINDFLSSSENSTILLFTHQIIWAKMVKPEPKVNGYNLLETELNENILDWLDRNNKKLIVISGDYGMNEDFYCNHNKKTESIFIANGIYDKEDDKILKLVLNEDGFYFKILELNN